VAGVSEVERVDGKAGLGLSTVGLSTAGLSTAGLSTAGLSTVVDGVVGTIVGVVGSSAGRCTGATMEA